MKEPHYSLSFAKASLGRAKNYLASGRAINWICHEIESAMLWAMEYWLRLKGHEPDVGNGWFSMRRQFHTLAGSRSIEGLYDCAIQAHVLEIRLEGGIELPEEENYEAWDMKAWLKEVATCLMQAENLLDCLEKGN